LYFISIVFLSLIQKLTLAEKKEEEIEDNKTNTNNNIQQRLQKAGYGGLASHSFSSG
jgi:hypothetical protein